MPPQLFLRREHINNIFQTNQDNATPAARSDRQRRYNRGSSLKTGALTGLEPVTPALRTKPVSRPSNVLAGETVEPSAF
jgi:hypothetical protein